MTSAFRALTAEPWAIRPDYLHVLANIAALDRGERSERRAAEGEAWFRRDLEASIGSPAQPLPGARYAVTTAGGVAIIPILGPIFPRANLMTEMSGGVSAAMLANDLRLAAADPKVGAVMLLVDSPGGSPTGINALADQIYAMRGRKRVVAHVTGSAASAAYWVASAAGELVAEKTSMLGSIGVVAAVSKQVSPNTSGEVEIEIVSSNAPNKRPDPQDPTGVSQIRTLLDGIEAQFIADVARGRKTTAARVRSDFGAGGMKVGQDAVRAGMADRVQSQDTTLRDLTRTADVERRARTTRSASASPIMDVTTAAKPQGAADMPHAPQASRLAEPPSSQTRTPCGVDVSAKSMAREIERRFGPGTAGQREGSHRAAPPPPPGSREESLASMDRELRRAGFVGGQARG